MTQVTTTPAGRYLWRVGIEAALQILEVPCNGARHLGGVTRSECVDDRGMVLGRGPAEIEYDVIGRLAEDRPEHVDELQDERVPQRSEERLVKGLIDLGRYASVLDVGAHLVDQPVQLLQLFVGDDLRDLTDEALLGARRVCKSCANGTLSVWRP